MGSGETTRLENIELACKSHNTYLAERDYGEAKMARYRRTRDSVSEAAARSG